LLPVTGPELVGNSDFSAGLTQWGTWQAPGSTSFAASPVSDPINCPSGCVRFQSGHRGDLLSSSVLNLQAGTAYVYRWEATAPATQPATFAAPYISRDGGAWDGMQDSAGFVSYGPLQSSAGETLRYEAYFVAKESTPARVIFQLETLGAAVQVHRASVRAVTGFQFARTQDWAQVVRNDAAQSLSLDCAALNWPNGCSVLDAAGNRLALPLAVAPQSSVLVLRGDSPFQR
jgi:hypothetical protein